jgi:RNase H-fold protein (predicted Holliday junction resolvase)
MPERSEDSTLTVLAVDPGREKCGLAVVHADGRVLHRAVVATSDIGEAVENAVRTHRVELLLLGDRTAAAHVCRALGKRVHLNTVMVDEHRSSEHGRRRYFRENPPRGWRRLLPLGLQTPPRPYDDYVAVVLAERYLAAQSEA